MKLTVATIVKNEARRWLPSALAAWSEFADRIVAVDDGSTDGTDRLLEAWGCEVHRKEVGLWGNETEARSFLWGKAVPGSEWVLHLDADHVPLADPREFLPDDAKLAGFCVFDMWDAERFRDDRWWTGHHRPFWLAANVSGAWESAWEWSGRGIHAGHLPANVQQILGPAKPMPVGAGLLHYGYARAEDRARKYAAYASQRAQMSDLEIFHANTIADEDPRLVELPFEPRWRLEWAG